MLAPEEIGDAMLTICGEKEGERERAEGVKSLKVQGWRSAGLAWREI